MQRPNSSAHSTRGGHERVYVVCAKHARARRAAWSMISLRDLIGRAVCGPSEPVDGLGGRASAKTHLEVRDFLER